MALVIEMVLLTDCTKKPATDTKLDSLQIKKVTDYLYEATLDYDFDYNIPKEYYTKYMPQLGGCSAISISNIRGRNYD